jgi:acetyltransferase
MIMASVPAPALPGTCSGSFKEGCPRTLSLLPIILHHPFENMNYEPEKLKKLFNPQTVALLGANSRDGSVGLGLSRNLLEGSRKRQIFLVNPYEPEVLGQKTYTSILDIPYDVDLAVIAVPCEAVLAVAKECAQKRVGAVVVISSGFAEIGAQGAKRQQELLDILQQAGVLLLGPNCLGLIVPGLKLNASFSPATPKDGDVAFLSQSGALIDSIIDKSLVEWYGFSALVSYGNEADINICDLLRFFAQDEKTKVLAIYLESVKNGSEFIKAASLSTLKKPVVVLKGGQTDLGQKAAASHTASLAGVAEVYSAAFEKAGIFEVNSINELLYVSLALAWAGPCENNLAIVTNGGAAGVLTADQCSKLDVKLAKFSADTLNKLEQSPVMNKAFTRANPLDILGDALSNRYQVALEAVLSQQNVEACLVIQTVQIMTELEENSQVIIRAAQVFRKPIFSLILGGALIQPAIKLLGQNRMPCFTDPQIAVLAFKALCHRKQLITELKS